MNHPINMAHMAKLFTVKLILSCNSNVRTINTCFGRCIVGWLVSNVLHIKYSIERTNSKEVKPGMRGIKEENRMKNTMDAFLRSHLV